MLRLELQDVVPAAVHFRCSFTNVPDQFPALGPFVTWFAAIEAGNIEV